MASPPLFEVFESQLKACASWKSSVICKGFTHSNQDRSLYIDICLSVYNGITLSPVHTDSKLKFDLKLFFGGNKEIHTAMKRYVIDACREAGVFLSSASASTKLKPHRLVLLWLTLSVSTMDYLWSPLCAKTSCHLIWVLYICRNIL